MNRKLLLLLAGAALTFSTVSFAHNATDDANHTHTVMESLTELKDSLKDTAKAGIEKFSEKASDIYGKLSQQIDEIFNKSTDKKDAKIEKLKQERDNLKKELDNYDKAENKTRTEEMRNNLVKRLEELNEKISDYNKSLKE